MRAPKRGGLSKRPAGTVCSSFEQTTGSLSALSTMLGPVIWKEKVWEECCLLGGGGECGNGFIPALPAEIWCWFYWEKGPGLQPSGRARHFLEFLGAEGPLVNKPTQLGSQRCKLCHEEHQIIKTKPLGRQKFRGGGIKGWVWRRRRKMGLLFLPAGINNIRLGSTGTGARAAQGAG